MAMMVNAPAMLTRENYQTWARQITRILECEGLRFWLEKKEWPDIETFTGIEKFRLKQSKQKAAGIVKSYCNPEIELLIGHLSDPSEIWSALKDALEIQGKGLKSYYLNEFRSLKPMPEEDFQTFIARYEESYRKVLDSGEEVPENHRCYHLVQSLPPEFDYLIRELENYEEKDFKFEKIKNEILKECFRRNIRKKIRYQLSMSTPACGEVKQEPTCGRRSALERGEIHSLWYVIHPSLDFEDCPVETVVPESSTLPVVEEEEPLEAEEIIPCTPSHAKCLPEAQRSKVIIDREIETMLERDVFSQVPQQEGQKVIGTRWVQTEKKNEEDPVSMFKARVVALGNHQLEECDFGEVCSPVINFSIIRLFIAIFIRILGCIHTMLVVKPANVYVAIDRRQIIHQPVGYSVQNPKSFVSKLIKIISVLLLSGRCWFQKQHTKSLCKELFLKFRSAYLW